jgi:hypothetical protein
MHYFTPDSKQSRIEWRRNGSLPLKQFKTQVCADKIITNVFWDRKGAIIVDFLPHGAIFNSQNYINLLSNYLHQAIRNKGPGKL